MATINVSSGQTSSGITLSNGDVMNVLSGGSATNTLVLSGGVEVVSSGGTAISTILSAGGVESVTFGAHDSGATISSGGTLIATQIGSGGVGFNALGDTVLSGGLEIASSGGWFQSASILGGSAIVSAGGLAQDITVASGGSLTVLSGADLANVISLASGGSMTVSSGGTTSQTTVSAGGTETMLGVDLFGTVVLSGGSETVGSGGTTSNVVVSAGGTEIVGAGGTAVLAFFTSTTVFGLAASGGTVVVSSGGTTMGATALSGGTENVLSGGTAISTILSAGGVESVTSGAFDSGATISSGGTLITTQIGSGGVGFNALGDTVLSGGLEIASSGGWFQSASILGGSAIVSAGGLAQDIAVASGGSLTVLSGAELANIVSIGSGGSMTVSSGAEADQTTVSAGGEQTVLGQAVGGTVLSGGSETVGSGGTTNFTVSSGGSEIVLAGGTASVGSGQTVFGLAASGGTIVVSSGGTTMGATALNGGTEIVSSGGTATVTTIGTSGSLDLVSGAIVSGAILFSGASGTLTLGGPTPPTNPIGGFVSGGDVVDLQNLTFFGNTSASFNSATDQLIAVEGATSATLQLTTADYTGFTWTLTNDTGGGTDVTAIPCYCRGTLILTEHGEVAVEELAVGDRVVTLAGAARPIKWIGRRSYSGRFALGQKQILPVCIAAGALADAVPRRDLWVSPNHALYLEGVLIEARDLVNGVSIVQAERVETIEYFHLELDSHDVLVAEGAPAESFIDDDSRALFHNAQEYWALYPDMAAGPARYCAPRREEGWEVERARTAIARRAGLSVAVEWAPIGPLLGQIELVGRRRITGWAQDAANPEVPVCLDIIADGELIGQVVANRYRTDLAAVGLGSLRHGFAFVPPKGLAFVPGSVAVRRSLDGASLTYSTNLGQKWHAARGVRRRG